MRVLVLGGTRFIGRRVVERLHERGDAVLVVHRGRHEPSPWVPVEHLRTERRRLAEHADRIRRFAPDTLVDAYAMTADDVRAVLPVLPEVPAVVLSSQDVYQAFDGLRNGRFESPVPLAEDAETRRERRPYRGAGLAGVPEDYEKLDVEELWLPRGAVVLRLPMVYGPHDPQRREELVLRRIRAGRREVPVGAGNLLWSRAHVDDVATGVLAALDTRAADGLAVNLAEPATAPIRAWMEQIARAAGAPLELVRVPEEALPPDLALTGAPAQHVLASVERARRLLGWDPGEPERRVAESVRWHLANPPEDAGWTEADARRDDEALRAG
ncbi:NAD-dependent epimerase/dehydratase family protein [Rothia sp. AR01]|uniref:NAD-dependent epimerase/dehydratase family protein n=1 Tax=Rothia santali TaxID=2949643 RepID=A0A9X2KHN6_9MICC|nr:NAD-dependent epimerase/dehydratase family protein [Rothia santali]MCP3424974.1 NAD-dependent epimerase/dehydratase family protein [Rothia santali]